MGSFSLRSITLRAIYTSELCCATLGRAGKDAIEAIQGTADYIKDLKDVIDDEKKMKIKRNDKGV